MAEGLTIDRIAWRPEHALARVEAGAAIGDHLAAEGLLERASSRVPYLAGTLAESRQVELGEGGEVAFGYTDKVAVYVHAHPEWNFRDGRSGHWLEEAIDADHEVILEVMGEAVRRELGG